MKEQSQMAKMDNSMINSTKLTVFLHERLKVLREVNVEKTLAVYSQLRLAHKLLYGGHQKATNFNQPEFYGGRLRGSL